MGADVLLDLEGLVEALLCLLEPTGRELRFGGTTIKTHQPQPPKFRV